MDLAFAGAVNLGSLFSFWALWNSFTKENATLSLIESSKTFTPFRLLQYLKNQKFLEKWTPSTDLTDEYVSRAFIEGVTKCDAPLKSIIDKQTELVYQLFYRDDIFSNDTFIKNAPELLRTDRIINAPLYFSLTDPEKNTSCTVHRSLDVEAIPALEKIAESKTYSKLSFIEKILVSLGVVIEFIAAATKNAFTFRGFKIGWVENELGIKTNSVLTAYGDVIYNKTDGTLRIEHPLYFLPDKTFLIKKLKSSLLNKKMFLVLITIPFLASSLYLYRGLSRYYRNYKMRNDLKKRDRLSEISKDISDDYKCTICCTNPRNIILKPCLHFLMCHICFEEVKKKNKEACPICKSPIIDYIEIFFS